MITDFIKQDTIKPKFVIKINTDRLITDSVFRRLDEVPAHIREDSARLRRKIRNVPEKITITDTTSVCKRNSIADVTFYDSLSFITHLKQNPPVQFPGQIGLKSTTTIGDLKFTIIQDLREGEIIHPGTFHHDWIIVILFVSAYLWLILRKSTRSMLNELTRFLLFRGINESSSRNISALFSWQSTILNFVSFLVIGLFCYCIAEYSDFIPSGIKPFAFMTISLAMVILSITSRHLICLAAGNLSGEYELFNEYLITIYQTYRFSAILLFAIVILLVYSSFLSVKVYFILGAIVLASFYVYRVIRLLLIFIKRSISILYLILYLCALEILPVLILVKYFTGLDV